MDIDKIRAEVTSKFENAFMCENKAQSSGIRADYEYAHQRPVRNEASYNVVHAI